MSELWAVCLIFTAFSFCMGFGLGALMVALITQAEPDPFDDVIPDWMKK